MSNFIEGQVVFKKRPRETEYATEPTLPALTKDKPFTVEKVLNDPVHGPVLSFTNHRGFFRASSFKHSGI